MSPKCLVSWNRGRKVCVWAGGGGLSIPRCHRNPNGTRESREGGLRMLESRIRVWGCEGSEIQQKNSDTERTASGIRQGDGGKGKG